MRADLKRAPLELSPLLVGDPLDVDAETPSPAMPAVAGRAVRGEVANLVPVGPGAAISLALADEAEPLSLRCVRSSASAGSDTRLAFVLAAPIRESGRALRLLSRLAACLQSEGFRERCLAARSREDLVCALAAVEPAAGELELLAPQVLVLLGSSALGLPAAEASRRLAFCGANVLERVRRRPLALRFAEQLVSLFAVLLWVAGACALVAGMAELGVAIFAVILVNGVTSFLQEHRAERAVEALEQLLPHRISVLREGRELRLPRSGLVPGDVFRLEAGDQVPADAQLLDAAGLRVDEAVLTGESHAVFKLPAVEPRRADVPFAERHDLVFAGTSVVAGSATCVVRASGMQTAIGDVAHLTQSVAEKASPLQREMARVTRIVTVIAVCFGTIFFALGVVGGVLPPAQGFLFALGVIVANVPEGLLPTLTLALALGVQRMARRRSVVKRLSSVETLGAMTVICTDKTGTLTENRMNARFAWASGRTFALPEPGEGAGAVRELLEAAALASEATATRGDPTELALVQAAVAAGADPEELRAARPLRAALPFDSDRKRMTLVRSIGSDLVAYTKGAPRETLALCDSVEQDGRQVPLTALLHGAILAEHDRLAAQGHRLLAVATRRVPEALLGAAASVVERELTCLGFVALWDPPRSGVAEAVEQCLRAGIRVVMVTGDYALTAAAIARRIGLEVRKVVSGEEVERLSGESLRGLVAEQGVLFARTAPAHKLAIVCALRELGEVVAVTGDGVNDAPALKAADIGVAMGGRGSEVAREAAEMVITDDHFESIVAAIRQGRAVYANIGKFVTYIFASNVPELVPFLVSVFFGIPLPLTLMQILAVDLGTDLLPALALGAEPPEPDVMEHAPRRRSDHLLGPARLLHAYGFLGVIEAALALVAFFWTYVLSGWRPGLPMDGAGELYRRATTMTLAGIVAAQVGNVFACRTERESVLRVGLLKNRLVIAGVAAEIALLVCLIVVPALARVFGLAPLRFAEWGLLLGFPPFVLLLEELRKAGMRALVSARRRFAGKG